MSSRRMIASDTFEDDFIGALDFFGQVAWVGLIAAVADDQGRMLDSSALIRSRVFVYKDILDSQVESVLCTLASGGKIARYVAANKRLIQIVKWWEYQTPAWAMPSKYPAPTGWTDRAKYHTTGNKIITLNWDKIGGYVVDYVPPLHSGLNEGDVKGDGDGEGEGEGEISPPQPPDEDDEVAEVFRTYEREIGIITPQISDEIKLAVEEYPPAWIPEAISEAVKYNARKWAYVLGVLKGWKKDGKRNGKGKGNPERDYIGGELGGFIQH